MKNLGWIAMLLLCQDPQSKTVTVKGVIRLKGERPVPKLLNVPQPYQKMCECEKIDPGDLVVGPSKGIQYAYIEIKGDLKNFEPAEARVVQKRGVYTPRMIAVGEKTNVKFENADGETHNVHLCTEDLTESIFNVITSPMKEAHEAKIERLGRFKMICDIHSWMKGWVIVTQNPWNAVSGADGEFEIANVTPGKHEFVVWHERLGEVTVTLDVSQGKDLVIELEAK